MINMNNIIVTGCAGAGKSMIAKSLLEVLAKGRDVIEYSASTLPDTDSLLAICDGAVVVLDECSTAFCARVTEVLPNGIEALLSRAVRMVVLEQSVSDLSASLLPGVAVHGGFRHIDIGLNELLAADPVFRKNMAVDQWSSLLSTFPKKNQDRGAKTVMRELAMTAVQLDMSSEERSELNVKLAMLSNVVDPVGSAN